MVLRKWQAYAARYGMSEKQYRIAAFGRNGHRELLSYLQARRIAGRTAEAAGI